MKKITLLTAVLVIMFAGNVNAQKVYVKLNAGYNFAMGSQNFGANSIDTEKEYQHEAVYGSFGKGLNMDASIGYVFKENIGVELGVSYLIGGGINKIHEEKKILITNKFKSNMLRINPSMIIEASRRGINPYVKIGFILGMGSITEDVSKSKKENNEYDLYYTTIYEYSGGFSYGANAVLGVYYPISRNMSLFGELTFVSMSYAPSKGKLITYLKNGEDKLEKLSINQKEDNFVTEYSVDKEDISYDDTKPRTKLIEQKPFGSFGFNFGINMKL
ncbi:MAG: hypothetical protein KAG96_02170 [Ichthyobacteriaceae bacterium]|nr:hypothetical protein [Ichthyobacteriaceae bacterium]